MLAAVSPAYALRFVAEDPWRAFLTLGTVVLAITGAEALYADMGHFGRRSIGRAWIALALPALLLCYAGQSALVLVDPAAIENPFYRLAPAVFLIPLIVLSSVATVIASQSIISGAFSVTQQAVRLGYLPRLEVRETSEERGQVYAPLINALLFVAVVVLVLGFGSSDALAAAFGLAVTATMVLTTLMIGFMVFHVWRWPLWWAVPLFATLLALDIGLFAASSTKLLDGGWLPLTVAVVLAAVFSTWRRGRTLVLRRLAADTLPIPELQRSLDTITRVAGTAVYLTSTLEGAPPALLHNLKHNRVLHERVILLTIETALTPTIPEQERVVQSDLGGGFERVLLRQGFMEPSDVPGVLTTLSVPPPPALTSYFLSRQTIVPSARAPGMAAWREKLFAALARIAETPMAAFRLPLDRVVELGSQVEI